MNRRFSAVAACLTLVLVSACSLSEGEQSSADSLSRALVWGAGPGDENDKSDCVADKWVGEVGTDRLRKDGLLNRKGEASVQRVRAALQGSARVSRKTSQAYAEAWFACTDFDEIALAQAKALPKASEEELDELADCLKERGRSSWTKAGMRVGQVRTRAVAQCARTVGATRA